MLVERAVVAFVPPLLPHFGSPCRESIVAQEPEVIVTPLVRNQPEPACPEGEPRKESDHRQCVRELLGRDDRVLWGLVDIRRVSMDALASTMQSIRSGARPSQVRPVRVRLQRRLGSLVLIRYIDDPSGHMSESCVVHSWLTYSLGKDMNEEGLEDFEELEPLTGLTAQLGKVEQVVSFSDPCGSYRPWPTGGSRYAK